MHLGIAHCSSKNQFWEIDYKTLISIPQSELKHGGKGGFSNHHRDLIFKQSLKHNITHCLERRLERLYSQSSPPKVRLKFPEGIVNIEGLSGKSSLSWASDEFFVMDPSIVSILQNCSQSCCFQVYDLSCKCGDESEELSGGYKKECENCTGSGFDPELISNFEGFNPVGEKFEPVTYASALVQRDIHKKAGLVFFDSFSCLSSISKYIKMIGRLSSKFLRKSYGERLKYDGGDKWSRMQAWSRMHYDDWIKKRD